MTTQGDARTIYGLAVTLLDSTTVPPTLRLDGALRVLDRVQQESVPSERLWQRHVCLMLDAVRLPLHERQNAQRLERELRSIQGVLARLHGRGGSILERLEARSRSRAVKTA